MRLVWAVGFVLLLALLLLAFLPVVSGTSVTSRDANITGVLDAYGLTVNGSDVTAGVGGGVSWVNVVFMNESFLNGTYLLKGENGSAGVDFDSASVMYHNDSQINQSYLLVGENVSNAYNATYDLWAYNQTTPAVDWVIAQGYLTTVSWVNVVFMNDTLLNATYMRLDDANLNASYLLVGENETNLFTPTNVVFDNITLLNATYVRLDNVNETYLMNDSAVNFTRIDLDGGGYVIDNGTTLILGHL